MLDHEAAQRGIDSVASRRKAANARPVGRVGRPEEVAALAVYLASSAAAFNTGAAIPIDGGETAG